MGHVVRNGREIVNVVPFAVVTYLRRVAGEEAVDEALRRAGGTQDAATLEDPSGFSTYEQSRLLFEAACDVMGDPHLGRQVGIDVYRRPRRPEVRDRLRALGHPAAVMRYIAEAASRQSLVHELHCLDADAREAFVTAKLAPGCKPSKRAYCEYIAGIIGGIPTIFAMDVAQVKEIACQAEGADHCLYHATWEPTKDSVAETEAALLARLEELTASFEDLEEVAAELEVARGQGTALQAIAEQAARAVRADRLLLAVQIPHRAPQVHAVGFGNEEAAGHAAELLAEQANDPRVLVDSDRLALGITSASHEFGRIAAYSPRAGRFLPDEARLLRAYAGLAAAALEATTAYADAEERADTTRVLLQLATELAEVTTREDVAKRLAHAMHTVADGDVVSVWIWNSYTHVLDCAGQSHRRSRQSTPEYRPDLTAISGCDPFISAITAAGGPFDVGPSTEDRTLSQIWSAMGARDGVLVPIVALGECFGLVVVGALGGGTSDRHALRARLAGVAGLASTAFHNARLLDEIRHQALHDALTDLPNRALVIDRLQRALARREHPLAVMFLDLDGFKQVNDTFGHGVGDQLLKEVSTRLAEALDERSTVGRLGGDEFVVIVEDEDLVADIDAIAAQLLEAVRAPFVAAAGERPALSVTVSVGIALGASCTSADDLLRDADVALYEAKGAGKDRAVTFEPAMHLAVQRRLALEMDLRTALGDKEFFLVYQPILDLSTNQVAAVEALVRWRRRDGSEVFPDEFIPTLEETGFIVPVGRWVLEESCRQVAAWHRDGFPLAVCVNVSARQLERDQFVDEVAAILESSGLDPSYLFVELTETSLVRNAEGSKHLLEAIRKLGVRIAIDDFGTGYSSLAYLQRFPVDVLKIDRSFIAAIADSPEQDSLVRMMVSLGRELGLRLVAEGIEEPRQLVHVRDAGCDSGQGYLFSRPLEPARLEHFLHGLGSRRRTGPQGHEVALPSERSGADASTAAGANKAGRGMLEPAG